MPALSAASLSAAQFDTVRQLVYRVAGIHLSTGKEGSVRSRLTPRLRALGLRDFDSYLAYLEGDASGAELVQLVDLITTNKTSFFREPEHFALLQRTVLPALAERDGPIRIWSAGCSSGEEAYTIAIIAREVIPAGADRVRVLATDISTRVLGARAPPSIATSSSATRRRRSLGGISYATRRSATNTDRDERYPPPRPVRAAESHARLAHERTVRRHLLPQRHDLLRPPRPSSTWCGRFADPARSGGLPVRRPLREPHRPRPRAAVRATGCLPGAAMTAAPLYPESWASGTLVVSADADDGTRDVCARQLPRRCRSGRRGRRGRIAARDAPRIDHQPAGRAADNPHATSTPASPRCFTPATTSARARTG